MRFHQKMTFLLLKKKKRKFRWSGCSGHPRQELDHGGLSGWCCRCHLTTAPCPGPHISHLPSRPYLSGPLRDRYLSPHRDEGNLSGLCRKALHWDVPEVFSGLYDILARRSHRPISSQAASHSAPVYRHPPPKKKKQRKTPGPFLSVRTGKLASLPPGPQAPCSKDLTFSLLQNQNHVPRRPLATTKPIKGPGVSTRGSQRGPQRVIPPPAQ